MGSQTEGKRKKLGVVQQFGAGHCQPSINIINNCVSYVALVQDLEA